jgi:hypothetical protein
VLDHPRRHPGALIPAEHMADLAPRGQASTA